MKMSKIENLSDMLHDAAKKGYAVGSFSARYTKLIMPIIKAAMAANSPAIVQLSEKEVIRHKVGVKEFADEFYRVVEELNPQVPLALHLDHTKTLDVIKEAIEAGFTSVMIDASEKEFEDNVAITKEVVEIAHPKNVTVEAELGKIGTTDFVETDTDEEMYTIPEEAAEFCKKTHVDALAVSVGTAHGVYTVRQPKVDYERLEKINKLTDTPLVLHGGSGVPSKMVVSAVRIPTGGVSKVNIATDLELAMLAVVGREGHMTEAELNSCSDEMIEKSRKAVQALVEDKIKNYLMSENQAV
jgi:fructose-bisphosphate aldolase class II